MKFMVAVGGTDEFSQKVFEHAVKLVNPEEDEVITVFITDISLFIPAQANSSDYSTFVQANEKMMENAEKVKSVFEQKRVEAGIKGTTQILTVGGGTPQVELCKLVEEHTPQFLIIGYSPPPRGTVKSLVTSTVTDYCLENANTNVIVVK